MKKLPSHIKPYSDDADGFFGFDGMTREEKSEYIYPLLSCGDELYGALARGDWGPGVAQALTVMMESLPTSYGKRQETGVYGRFFRLTGILDRLAWDDGILEDMLHVASDARGHDPYDRFRPHWENTADLEDFVRIREDDGELMRCFRTVCRRGMFLAFIPGRLLTYDMCIEAVLADFRALRFVPQELRDGQIFQFARISLWREAKLAQKEINLERRRMYDIVREAWRFSPEKIKERLRYKELSDPKGDFLEFGPSAWDAQEHFFEQLPPGYQEKWIGELEVIEPKVIQHEKFGEIEICSTFLKSGYAKKWRKRNKKAREAETSLKGKDLALFRKLEQRIRMDGDGRAIWLEKPSKAVCLELVRNFRDCLQYLPEELIDKKTCMAAIEKDPLALRHVPKRMIDQEMAMAAVEKDGMALQFVPDGVRTRSIIDAASGQNPDAKFFCAPKEEGILERKEREYNEQLEEWIKKKEKERKEWKERDMSEREKYYEEMAMRAEMEEREMREIQLAAQAYMDYEQEGE